MKYDVYSAFGNQVRTKLMLCLAEKSKNVTELIGNCGLAQSAVSQHLARLRMAGMVETHKQGKEIYYELKYKRAAEIGKMLMLLEQEAA